MAEAEDDDYSDVNIIQQVSKLEKEAAGKKMARLERENLTLTKMNDSLERRAQAMKIRTSKQ